MSGGAFVCFEVVKRNKKRTVASKNICVFVKNRSKHVLNE